MKLNQVLANNTEIQVRGMRALTDSYHDGQRAQLLEGLSRTYQRDNDDGEDFPAENKVLQVRMKEVLAAVRGDISKMARFAAMREVANCEARADVEVDGKVLLENVPATYLLWLEKHLLTHLKTFANKLPCLHPGEEWVWSDSQNCYVSRPVQTVKSKKEPRVITKAEPTEHHPAQAEIIYEDKRVGVWTATKYSGALPKKDVQAIQDRIQILLEAVKSAREKANTIDVPKIPDYGEKILGFILDEEVNARE